MRTKLDKHTPNLHSVEFRDSNNNLVDTIILDTNVYRLTTYQRRKYLNNDILSKWLEDNGVFSKHSIFRNAKYKRDGFEITVPSVIRLVTEVPDDRNIPGPKESYTGNKALHDFLVMTSVFSKMQ